MYYKETYISEDQAIELQAQAEEYGEDFEMTADMMDEIERSESEWDY